MIRRPPDAGFTLIEMLIAVALLSLVTAALFSGIRLIGGAANKGRSILAMAVEDDDLRQLFRRQVETMFPVRGAGSNGQLIFVGHADRLSFPIVRGLGQGPGGLILATFAIQRLATGGAVQGATTAQGSEIVYQEFPFLAGPALAVSPRPSHTIVVGHLAGDAAFSFRGTDGRWRDGWEDGTTLPRLVQLRDGADVDLVAAVMMEIDPVARGGSRAR